MLGDGVQPLPVVLDPLDDGAVAQDGVEDVQEELQAELVQPVDLVEVLDGEVDAGNTENIFTLDCRYPLPGAQDKNTQGNAILSEE